MSFKSILTVASGAPEDADVFRAAAKFAQRHGAHVRVMPAFPDPAADLVYYGLTLQSSSVIPEQIAESERAAQQRIQALADEIIAAEGLKSIATPGAASMTVEQRALQPAVALAPAAVLADLVLFGASVAASAGLGGLFAETLLATRAPCFLVKQGAFDNGAVAVAWDGSAQAARAARAALPLLQAASRVVILRNVDDQTPESEAGGDPARLGAYLALHGVAKVETRTLHGGHVAQSLLDAARKESCELLVAGAYGRPRLFEMVLGGTTRALVHAADGPNLLLAH
ncbi:MAG TPA: universal stress protein [Vitreimonas sp.]|uniref:universal stress protein n=1 Tax=Vitreimonas sp. TaxID=3069702 RepID=UPI002D38CCDF|nr:universal stress protein [Vitreimonas sp.]HYD88906.1 universal stress protein [Vitreimonas sp.]